MVLEKDPESKELSFTLLDSVSKEKSRQNNIGDFQEVCKKTYFPSLLRKWIQ